MTPHNNPNSTGGNASVSTPTKTSFASALAQMPTSSKPDSPSKINNNNNSNNNNNNNNSFNNAATITAPSDQSPIVKLPGSSADKKGNSSNTTNSASPSVNLGNNVKVAPIKFGSFAAAAASAAATPIETGSNNTSSTNNNNSANNNGPILPPRTQSAPPNVIELKKQSTNANNTANSAISTTVTSNTSNDVDMEAPVVLPSIQEDSHNQQQQQQQQAQIQEGSFGNTPQPLPYDPNSQYQPRPHRYYNPNGPQQHSSRHQHYNNYGYTPNYYAPQQNNYHPHPQHGHNPNYRGNYQNYRPRYHNYNQYPPQGEFYHPNGPIPQAAYYPPAVVGATNAPFQRPAPALNTFVAQPVAPSVPSDLPTFTTNTASKPIESSSNISVPAVKPASAKIKIVDPNTGKELNFGAASKKEESTPTVALKPSEPVAAVVEPVKPVAVKGFEGTIDAAAAVAPVKPAEPVQTFSTNTSLAPPAKKISIVIKDPNSNKELDLSQVVARPVASIKEDLAVDELTAAFSQGTKLEEDDFDGDGASISASATPSTISASPAPFEHDKTILANLNVDDDELSDEYDDEDEDYSDVEESGEEDEEEEEIFIPSTVQYNQSISYPEGCLPFQAPAEGGLWLYSREFMLQFREKCTTTPGDLQERLSAAVEKAKAFASSERINGSDRRDNGRRGEHSNQHDRKKRRGNGGPLGPQAHLLDMNAVLKNRAENAWAPVRSAEELSQVDRILREVKGLLNKLTLEKFHVISDKILALGIMSSDVLSGVIDCIFDKSVSEPRFAPMYAELCYKIVVEELNGLKKTLPANVAPDSQFRRLLVERCQAEYKHKRAWSKKRLEKLLDSTATTDPATTTAASEPVVENTSEGVASAASNVGELTEEDYLLIKLKRRVLGNMRFIGEIFKVGLIGEKIMHSIITELLSNVENPEEEEIECLCRLLMTVGAILDKPEAANFWNQYLARMNWLVSHPGILSSRVRFLVMDTVESREKKWRTGRAEEGPKTIAQIQKEQYAKERNERDRERERERDRERERERERDRNNHRGNNPINNGPAIKFTTKSGGKQQPQQPPSEEWNRSGKGGSLSRGPSMRSNSTTSSPVITSTAGNFGVLSGVEAEPLIKPSNNTSESSVSDSERVKKIVSLLDELVQMNNYPDVYEEIVACSDKSAALSGLLSKAIESNKPPALQAVIRIFTECPTIDKSIQLAACKRALGTIDDLAVDVPSVYEMAGRLYAALQLSLPEMLETVADCSDDSAKARLLLHAINLTESPEAKAKIMDEGKEFLAAQAKKLTVANLANRLGIQIA